MREDVVPSAEGYILFDDVVLDKRHSRTARLVRRQWSGNEKRVIYGIGVVTCVYVNPETNPFWIIDYRVYDPEGDDLNKLDHLLEMLGTVSHKTLPFNSVLMDTWYASMHGINHGEQLGKLYYCPVNVNRRVDDSEGENKHQRVDSLDWTDEEAIGKTVHLKQMPKGHRLKLFRLARSTERTDFIMTNDLTQNDLDVVRPHCGVRWKIEPFHREAKQVTGRQGCQCRISRALRNHIACSFLVWAHLKRVATQLNTNVYQLKVGLLDDYMSQQLKEPTIPMRLCA